MANVRSITLIKMKRYIYIILGIIVLFAVGLLVFWLFTRNQSGAPGANGGTTGTLPITGTQNPGMGSGGNTNAGGTSGNSLPNVGPNGLGSGATQFGVVSAEPVFGYFVDKQNNDFLVEPDGKIAEVTSGQVSYLSSSPVTDLIDAGFSYDGTMAFVNFGDVNVPQSSVFNIGTKAWAPIPSGFISPAWSPSYYRIAYIQNTTTTETLMTLDVSKSTNKPAALITLDARDLALRWLNKNQIVLFDKPSAYTAGSAWLFNLQTKTLSPIVSEWPGFEATWTGGLIGSTTPMGLAFSGGTSARGGNLELIDPSGNKIEALSFLTLPSKCFFNDAANASGTASLALYCAIPTNQNTFSFARLPDDYDQMSLFATDAIYRINTTDGRTNALLATPSISIDATDLKIFNSVLYFVNRYDSKLYAISLAE